MWTQPKKRESYAAEERWNAELRLVICATPTCAWRRICLCRITAMVPVSCHTTSCNIHDRTTYQPETDLPYTTELTGPAKTVTIVVRKLITFQKHLYIKHIASSLLWSGWPIATRCTPVPVLMHEEVDCNAFFNGMEIPLLLLMDVVAMKLNTCRCPVGGAAGVKEWRSSIATYK